MTAMTTSADRGAPPIADESTSVIPGAPPGYAFRPATAVDLPACARIWRESINDYLRPLNLPEIPDDLGPILRLYAHLQATDPGTFVVAEPVGVGKARAIDAFVVVVVRGRLRFLSMLFVLPRAQGRGLGRGLLDAVLTNDAAVEGTAADRGTAADGAGAAARTPAVEAGAAGASGADVTPAAWHATSTDSAQPISNGLYASFGMVPRMPLLRLVGLPEHPDVFPDLPDGIGISAFDEIDGRGGGLGTAALAAEVAALDRDAVGFERAIDHAFVVAEGRRGFLYHDRTGAAVGYGYTSESGRVGPIAVADPALLGAVVGHLVTAVRPRGAFGLWVPGAAGEAVVPLLRAGFRFDGFPVLLCWDRPFADFSRYLPISPGLL
jgi:GNAT superfamily N-acetyltransferase